MRKCVNLLFLFLILSGSFVYGQVSMSTSYTQNFDGLGTTTTTWVDGTLASPTLQGWCYNLRNGTVPTTMLVDNGSTASSGLIPINLGTTGASDRCAGIISSSTTTAPHYLAVRLKNTSGGTVSSAFISFHGETWKINTNTGQTTPLLTFGSLNSTTAVTNIGTGTYTANTALNYTGTTGTAGAVDGNAVANSAYVSSSLSATVLNNSELVLRWNKVGTSSAILGIDDFIASWEPTTQPSSLTFPTVATTSLGLSYTAGATGTSGVDGYIILQKSGSAISTGVPVKGTTYTVGATLGDATVAYVGSSTAPATFTGLTSSTTYYYAVYAYNGTGKGINYLTSSPLTGSQQTSSSGTPPTTQPSFSTFTNIGTTTLTANWAAGNGSARVVYMNSSNSFSAPSDGSTPTAATAWANAGQQCIYNGSGTTVNLTGLSAGTTYYFQAYEYNTGTSTYYLVTSPPNTSQATVIVPVTQSSAVNFTSVGPNGMTINWTSGSGANRIVRVNATNSFTAPSNGTPYTANTVYASGEQTVYNGSGATVPITGLSQGITYYVEIFEYNGTGTGITYNTTSPATGNQTTTVNPPSTQPTFTAFTNIGTTSVTANWTVGNGAGRVVYINSANSFTDPATGNSPSANTVWANAGQQCIYNGTGTNNVAITGLTAGTQYYVQAYEYNGSGATITFFTTTPANSNTTTVIVPATLASAINFTSVAGTGMNINWTSGSGTNRIVRMNTTNSFTAPTPGTSYTASATYTSGERTVYNGTGAATVAVTGLTTLTRYYVQIYEYNGTGTGITYSSGSAVSDTITPDGSNTTDYFRSAVTNTGTWATVGTWESSHDSSSWFPATLAPDTSAAGVSIEAGDTITVATTLRASNIKVEVGGQLTVSAALTINTGKSLTVNGIVSSSSTISGTMAVNNGGTYKHNSTTGTIPTATWNTGSTCEITGALSAAPSGLGQSFYNFKLNGAYGTTPNFAGALTTVNGTLSVVNTGSIGVRLISRSASGTVTCGALNISGGKLEIIGGGTAGATTGTLTVTGDVTISGGTLSFGNNNNASSISILNVGGNFNMSGGFVTDSSTTTARINFTKSGTQSFTKTSGYFWSTTNGIKFSVNSGSTLQMVSNLTNSNGTNTGFTLSSGAGLIIQDAAGITTSSASGSIQVTGTRTYNTGANYIYAGSALQSTGNGLPSTVNDLKINNSNGVTLSGACTINGTLELSSGILNIGNNSLSLASTATISGNTPSSSNMVVATGTGVMSKVLTGAAPHSFTFPVGDNFETVEYSPVDYTLNSGTFTSETVGVKLSNAKHGSNTNIDNYINRYWTLSSTGVTSPNYNATFTYSAADVYGTESVLKGNLWNGSAWTELSSVNTGTHSFTASSQTVYGDFTAIGAVASSGNVIVTVIPQGYYNAGDYLNSTDTVSVILADASTYANVDSAAVVLDSVSFSGTATFSTATTGSYYLVVKQRSSVETWSTSTIAFTQGSTVSYNFTDAQNKAYGDNQVEVNSSPVRWAIYGGDCNQDGYVDPLDMSLIDQDSFNYVSGSGLATDVNGDHFVDPLDMSIADQNSFNYVGIKRPVSAKTVKMHSRAQQGIHFQDLKKEGLLTK